ncbi:MAG TPA: hypothetical protein VHM16_02965 [Rubrobacteraceae bacterium]|nr:hypothetical protein [Rubrobacteraceae bacterium]
MDTLIVLVDLRDGVNPEDYERWISESYRPAVMSLPSVDDWRGYRIGGDSPFRYVVTVEVNDAEQLGRDAETGEMRRLLGELGNYAEVTQMMAERFV